MNSLMAALKSFIIVLPADADLYIIVELSLVHLKIRWQFIAVCFHDVVCKSGAGVAQKFEHFLEVYRRPDGSTWGGQDLHDATGGVVTRSYVTTLRKGHIENPGCEKLRAIAKAMNFPPEL